MERQSNDPQNLTVWYDKTNRHLSFHQIEGYTELCFGTEKAFWDFIFQCCNGGYKIS